MNKDHNSCKNCNSDNDDFVIPGPPLSNGSNICIRHSADHSLQIGEMRPLKKESLSDDTILLFPREGSHVYNVIGSIGDLKKGPLMVNSQAYKNGWESIFGKQPIGQA
jgi:hypothetical protein